MIEFRCQNWRATCATEIPLTQSFSEAELLTVGGLLQEGNIVAGYRSLRSAF